MPVYKDILSIHSITQWTGWTKKYSKTDPKYSKKYSKIICALKRTYHCKAVRMESGYDITTDRLKGEEAGKHASSPMPPGKLLARPGAYLSETGEGEQPPVPICSFPCRNLPGCRAKNNNHFFVSFHV